MSGSQPVPHGKIEPQTLKGALARASKVFELAGRIGLALLADQQTFRRTNVGAVFYGAAQSEMRSTLVELVAAILHPPEGFEVVAQSLRRAVRICNSIGTSKVKSGSQQLISDMTSIAVNGCCVVYEAIRAGQVPEPFTFTDRQGTKRDSTPPVTMLDQFPTTSLGNLKFLERLRDEVNGAAEAKRHRTTMVYSNATLNSMISGIKWTEARLRTTQLSEFPSETVEELTGVLWRELDLGTIEQLDELLTPVVRKLRNAMEKPAIRSEKPGVVSEQAGSPQLTERISLPSPFPNGIAQPSDHAKTLSTIPASQRFALLMFQAAEIFSERKLTDREAYDLISEGMVDGKEISSDGVPEDYDLPSFETWGRYVRAARKVLDLKKYEKRDRRARGRSIAKPDQL